MIYFIPGVGGGNFHMLGGGGGYGGVPPVRVYFLRTCVLSGMLFNLIVS